MSNSTLFLFVQQLWWSLPCNSSSLPPWRTPAACLEDPRGSPWEASSPDLPLSLIIATCRAALQPRLAMKGCRKSFDCPFNNTRSLTCTPSSVVLIKQGCLRTSWGNSCIKLRFVPAFVQWFSLEHWSFKNAIRALLPSVFF